MEFKKKKNLEDAHEYIINFPNITFSKYESCRIYILSI